jgi:hypothetical protein
MELPVAIRPSSITLSKQDGSYSVRLSAFRVPLLNRPHPLRCRRVLAAWKVAGTAHELALVRIKLVRATRFQVRLVDMRHVWITAP